MFARAHTNAPRDVETMPCHIHAKHVSHGPLKVAECTYCVFACLIRDGEEPRTGSRKLASSVALVVPAVFAV